ncbi:MAG: hypothetical protein WB799_01245 [Candidatus Sulfotelmatobacter sp.]
MKIDEVLERLEALRDLVPQAECFMDRGGKEHAPVENAVLVPEEGSPPKYYVVFQ